MCLDCVLYAVGKPVYHRYTDALYGAWMRDPQPRTDIGGDKFWVTKDGDPYHLYEYANKTMFRKDIATRNYTLQPAFKVRYHKKHTGMQTEYK